MSTTNTFHEFWFGLPRQRRVELARALDTSEAYLEHIAGGYKLPSMTLATRLVRACKGVTYQSIVAAWERKQGRIGS